MYAVIETGGKQYRVQSGDYLQIEKCEGDVGSALKFDQVLFIRQPDPEKAVFSLGKPYLPEASVEAEILGQGRGEKILIVKMKRRKQYRRTQGHRQYYTQVLITAIRPNQTEAGSSLNDAEKQTKRTQFQSHLKPKGNAFTAPLLGSREKRKNALFLTQKTLEKTDSVTQSPS